jgi:hypothetical protein
VTVKSKSIGALVAVALVGTGITALNNPDLMKGFINVTPETNTNYDDGPEKVIVRLTWGRGQLAIGHISVNNNDYLSRTLDNIKDKGGSAPTWILRPNKGDVIEANIIPHITESGSSCTITDPKHPEAIKPPAATASYVGGSHCIYTVLG